MTYRHADKYVIRRERPDTYSPGIRDYYRANPWLALWVHNYRVDGQPCRVGTPIGAGHYPTWNAALNAIRTDWDEDPDARLRDANPEGPW